MTKVSRTTKVKLYNAKTGETVVMQAWAAEHALKHNHVSRHGKFCRVADVKKYITLPKSPKPVQEVEEDPKPRRGRKKAAEEKVEQTED